MQVFQTEGDPPSRGRIILAIIGWTQKSSEAETKSVRANRSGKAIPPPGGASSSGSEDVLGSEHVEMMLEGPMLQPRLASLVTDHSMADSFKPSTRGTAPVAASPIFATLDRKRLLFVIIAESIAICSFDCQRLRTGADTGYTRLSAIVDSDITRIAPPRASEENISFCKHRS